MIRVAKLVKKVMPVILSNAQPRVLISVSNKLVGFVQLAELTKKICKYIIEPRLNENVIRMHLLQLVKCHFYLTITEKANNKTVPSLRG